MSIDAIRDASAPAKLNLFLHVLGRRSDGYHELETVFVPIDLADTLHLVRRSDASIERIGHLPGVAVDDDLSVRAAKLLQRASGSRFGATIEIDKRIPMGAGLGGGSSDAATVLLALNRLWELNWPQPQLADLALQLGADVPFFVFGKPAYARGIGEKLEPLPQAAQDWLPSCAVLVAPAAHVSTAHVFSAPELTRDTKPIKISGLSRSQPGLPGRNDLEPVVLAQSPAVAQAKQALIDSMQQAGHSARAVRMTGSGACVFGALADVESAEVVAAGVRQARVGEVMVVRVLPAHPLHRWAFRE